MLTLYCKCIASFVIWDVLTLSVQFVGPVSDVLKSLIVLQQRLTGCYRVFYWVCVFCAPPLPGDQWQNHHPIMESQRHWRTLDSSTLSEFISELCSAGPQEPPLNIPSFHNVVEEFYQINVSHHVHAFPKFFISHAHHRNNNFVTRRGTKPHIPY